jgi:hypothetical protein
MTRHHLPYSALAVFAVFAATVRPAAAEVSKVDLTHRGPVGSSGYEKLVGTVQFRVDPAHPRNQGVVDLDKAAKDADGRVVFSADLYILRPLPKTPSNGVALVDVVNRGRKMTLNGFNRGGSLDPATEADLGDGFLMQHGFTLVWVGWQFDVRREDSLMGIDVPSVPAMAPARAVFTPNDRSPDVTIADLAGYSPVDGSANLTVRDGPYGPASEVPRDRWRLAGNVVSMPGGFEAGRTYEIVVRTTKAPLAGLGLVALRDIGSWLKHPSAAAAPVRHAIAFGSSQSGRFLRTFMYQGFNADEKDRLVYDGVMAHIAGAGKLSLNERGATPNALSMFDGTAFPYADKSLRDPISGRTDGLLENERARRHQPKVFYTNSAVEYWGGGRSAALLHTTPDGKADLEPPANVRVYLLAGTQHSPGRFPPRATTGQQPDNPVEYWWTLRALLLSMERWIKDDVAPPASRYPKLADGTLVAASAVAFPRLPGVRSPHSIPPARSGATELPHLVSQLDEDGNERAGVRAPELAVPLATYTGWNFRAPSTGGSDQLVNLAGSSIRFPRTKAEAEKAGDPRRAIAQRYASREEYLQRVQRAVQALVAEGYLLEADVPRVMARAGELWAYSTDL